MSLPRSQEVTRQDASLLVSLHDVSPLTLEDCKLAVSVLRGLGFPMEALTLLTIPYHEAQVRLCDHDDTLRFVKQLEDAGATVIMHGLTHRMPKQSPGILAFPLAYGFARGQGEFYLSSELQVSNCLADATAIMQRAGFASAATRFVPPAWLISKAGRTALQQANLEFYELLDGIHWHDQILAKRLIGWGSLTALECKLTSAWAFLSSLRSPCDTRLVIHPAELTREVSTLSLMEVLPRLREKLVPMSYNQYLRSTRGT